MTDAEIICEFMEPNAPKDGTGESALKKFSPLGWWRYSLLSCTWKQPLLQTCPEIEKLGRLHEVEARLTEEQWMTYDALLQKGGRTGYMSPSYWAIHATAEQKIAALAAVLRAEAARVAGKEPKRD